MNNTNSNNSTSTSEVTSQSEGSVAQESELNRPTTQSQSKMFQHINRDLQVVNHLMW